MKTKLKTRCHSTLRRLRLERLDLRLTLDADDALSEAIPLGVISATTPTVRNDNISPADDVDMYRITINVPGQTIDFDIDTAANGPGGLGSFIRLFNSAGQQIASNNDGAAPGENTVGFDAYLRFTFPTNDFYYLGVSNNTNVNYNSVTGDGDVTGGSNTTGNYTLTVQALPDDFDDTLAESQIFNPITATPQTKTDNIITDVDVDIYRFSVNTGQIVDFDIDTTANGPGGLGSFIRIFDTTGAELAFNDDGIAPGETVLGFDSYLRHTFATAGTYYIGVSNFNNTLYNVNTGGNDRAGGQFSIGAYTLTVNTAPAIPADPDDTLTEATNLGAVSTTAITRNDSISPDSDVDLYRFSVTAGLVVDFDIDTATNGAPGLGSYIRLFDSTGAQLASNNDGAAPGENTVGFDAYLRHTFATAGTYYLGVSNLNNITYNPVTGDGDTTGGANATGNYTLIIQALPIDTDDTIAESTNLGTIGVTPISRNDQINPDIDVDLYRFTVATGQVVDFDIDTTANGPGGLGSFLRIFDSAGVEIAFNDNATAPGENVLGFDAYIRRTFAAAGTYYVGVSNANNTLYNINTGLNDFVGGSNSIGAYTLTVQTPSTPPADPDDTLTEATALGAISTTPISRDAVITPDVDVDLYQFTVTAGQVIDFDIDTTLNGTGGLGSFLRLFDSAGSEIAFNNDAIAPGENTLGFDAYLRRTFSTNGTFYIGVSNANNTLYNAVTGGGDVGGGANGTGDYRLTIQALPVDDDDQLNEAPFLGAVSTTPVVRSAAITPDIDVDLYRFTATAGQIVDFDIDTTLNGPGGLGSFLRLFNSAGTEIAFNNDAAAPGEGTVGFDAYLRFAFTTSDTYYVGVSNANNTLYNTSTGLNDAAGGFNSVGNYDLRVQVVGTAGNDTDDTLAEATALGAPSTTPITSSSSISPDTDVNMYSFTAAAGQVIDLDIDTPQNGPGGLGSFIRLFDSTGAQLASNDNAAAPGEGTVGFDAYLRFTAPTAGTFYLGVSNANNINYSPVNGTGDVAGGSNSTGSYQLVVTSVSTAQTLGLSSLATSISEAGGTTTGTVTRTSSNISAPLVVNLSSNDTGEATVPSSVTIPANQTSITFTITGIDDSVVDGTQNVTITATASAFTSATLGIQVTDNDAAATLGLSSLATSISEGGGTTTGTVTRTSANISSPLVVNLSSNDTSEATVPASVTIPANQTSATFTITGINDVLFDGTQNVTITATAAGFSAATLNIQVTDNETEALALSSTLSSISEGGGSTAGTVTRTSANISAPLVVNLSSNDTSEATVPASITIPANQTSATFAITGVDDAIMDGSQNVVITATASGLTSATLNIQVRDNDSAFTNPDDPLDVNDDGRITAFDALPIVTYLNLFPAGSLPTGSPPPYLDVNSDNQITAFDALEVITYLNLHPIGGAPEFTGAPEATSAPESAAVAQNAALVDVYFSDLGRERRRSRNSAEDASKT